MGPHQLCWGSSGTWSSSVTAPTPRLGGFALLLRRAWLQTSRDKAAWIWGKALLDLIQGGAVCWVIVACPREIFTSCFCCFNLIWEVFTSSHYIIYNYFYCARTHTYILLCTHILWYVVWNWVHTTKLVLYIYFMWGSSGGRLAYHAFPALGCTVRWLHSHSPFFTTISSRKCPLYCNWRTVMHQLFLRCGWLFIEATSHSNAYVIIFYRSIEY